MSKANDLGISRWISKLKPDFRFSEGNIIVPSKTMRYKQDPITKRVVKIYPPKSVNFEKSLNTWLKEETKGSSEFPTDREVFVLIVYNFVSKKEYNKCDLDNRTKTILDGMQGVIFQDDSQVRTLLVAKKNDKKLANSYGVAVSILKNDDDRKFLGEFSKILYK